MAFYSIINHSTSHGNDIEILSGVEKVITGWTQRPTMPTVKWIGGKKKKKQPKPNLHRLSDLHEYVLCPMDSSDILYL